MRDKKGWSIILVFLAASAFAQEDPVLSIRILEKWGPAEVWVRSPAGIGVWNSVKLTRGQMTVNGKALKKAVWGRLDSNTEIRTKDLTRIYPGETSLCVQEEDGASELLLLDHLTLKDYTACVTASEAGHDRSRPEYLKALGAVVRRFALGHRHRHPGYDLCDLAHCQVYQGLPPRPGFWKEMAQAGESYDPKVPAGDFYFSRCCGGLLESASALWGGPRSGARTGADEWEGRVLCREDPSFQWTTRAKRKELEGVLAAMAHLAGAPKLSGLEVAERTPQGSVRVLLARFEGPEGGTRTIRQGAQRFLSEFGKRYGWRTFPSDRFELEQRGEIFRFKGKGFGHGVGLCQSGARELAKMGWDWRRILDFYFPGK